MTPLEAANEAQRIAADPAASVFVTANAGSGKTKVLVDRIARLLLEGSKPSAFLCITYTKAAAAEMQRRLFERLGAWCVADDAKLAAELMSLAGEGAKTPTHKDLALARALFARALETPGGLRIQTIHAFCERLLARFPLEAGVPPGFDIADEMRAGEVLRAARASCMLNADHEAAEALARFAARLHNDSLEGLLNRFVMQRRDLARHIALRADARLAMRARHGVEQDAETFAAEAARAAPWARLAEAEAALAASTAADQKLARRIAAARADYAKNGPSRAAVLSLARVALKEEGDPYDKPVTRKLADRQPWIATLIDDIAAWALAALERLNAIDRAFDAAAALTLASRLEKTYAAAKTRLGVLDFDDLIEHAHALLSRADAAPWVLYKLDGGVDHILIDEGQDTSAAQWELIEPLQSEFFAGGGAREKLRTVFAVGDPKQSIYAFQGADPERFLAEAQTLSARAHEAGRKFRAPILETSFRSSPEILRVVDATFAGKDLASGAPSAQDETRHLASREHEPGFVELWPVAFKPQTRTSKPWDAPLDVETGVTAPALLAKAVAKQARRWIDEGHAVWEKGALRPMHAGDILALVKKRGPLFHELIKAFKRHGLPVAGADRMTLKDELAVEDCLALMRVALDPTDDLALACVLKGPWCDLDNDDQDLFPLAHGRQPGQSLYARLMADDTLNYASARTFVGELGARTGEDAFSFLSWALDTIHGEGRSGWQRCFARLGLEARDPLEELLSRALRPSVFHAPSLQRFLHEIETDAGQIKRELEAAGRSVRVMTVHGAKGLEAPVVILPDCTSPVADRPEDGIIFAEDGPHLSPGEKSDDAVTAAARAKFKEHARGEHLRLLYVAMTRARDRLVVCGAQHANLKTGEAEGCWRMEVANAMAKLGQPCETPFGEGLRLGEPLFAGAGAADETCAPPPPEWSASGVAGAKRIGHAAPSRLKPLDSAVFSPRGDGQKRFRRGRLIHGLLERLPDVAPASRNEQARVWLRRQGVREDEAEALAGEALGVIANPQFASAFAPSSRAEAPIVGMAAGKPVRGVVDRLVVDDGGVLILDFKTDRPAPERIEDAPDAYILQMALYREVLRQIFVNKIVRCALLWTEAPRLMLVPDTRMDAVFEVFSRG
ncbi:MAG TPA: double-strand break repair helicase AddA [Caulobacterales bacterium]|nr:double-strand break repair helicase AddA [Caulobacterales bacterium]